MENDKKNDTRLSRWTQKLLDLSLRNRLLNARESKQVIPLAVESLGELEDRLADGGATPIESADATARRPGSLRSSLGAEDLARRLKQLHRLAKTDFEESGVNALYLALGFLAWKGRESGAKACRAPLLLVPVSLVRKSVREGYAVERLDEETRVNETLLEFLRVEFGLKVEGVDPLPEDANGIAVDEVMQAFRSAVDGREGWSVECDAALGHFSFGKFVMWKDLTARADALAAHPLVAHLMSGKGDYDDGVAVFPPGEIESKIEYGSLFTPLSADSSQLAAVLYSAAGKSFVLHGPPGTGKSQTIANLVAHNLALGRRVLFVSEKKAALDVVHRRLAAIGLKPFCLELHSNKSGKTEVLAQIREAMEFADRGLPNEWARTVESISRARDELDGVVAALHRRQRNGLSAYDCFASEAAGGPDALPFADWHLCAWSEEDVADERERLVRSAADWRETTREACEALAPAGDFAWNPAEESSRRDRLAALRAKPAVLRGFATLFGSKGLLAPAAGFKARFRGFTSAFADSLDRAVAAMGGSRGVMGYRASRAAAAAPVGTAFAEALESGALAPERMGEAFDRSFAAATLKEILSKEPALAMFSGLRHEERILAFRKLDAEYAELVRHAVRARLAAALPGGRGGDCPDGCELGVIRRECAKKARQKPIRQLLAETRGVIGRLKPCFLMSPLSVAQYLPPEATFDLVVFDEASQIPVWDAIGVIARAKQCVVVGDPRQMPPTNFFNKCESAEEDGEESEDLESILDECLAAGLHSAHLDWHYRSRHESLIAFSNHNYYEDRLMTFPAARSTPRLGVRSVFVEKGVYDAKASRTNRAEAEALVDYVFERLGDPAWKRRSAGVVTFSMAQKNLIEDLIEARRAEDPSFESYFNDDGEEPFFVKNLENVQGDERDVILFSVGYAKGADGKFLMNFGPLNRAGGERRLNVAVTRAKEQIVVFASCKGAEIDLSRTQATGAKHLKAFLEYAERGGAAAPGEGTAEDAHRDRFADEVAAFLASKGYETERDVGCSGFRIDIGVRARGADAFMAAVECDGASYAACATVRDRDQLRASVLRSLGWNTLRVWAADWALARDRAEARLVRELEEIASAPDGLLPEPTAKPEVTFPRRREVRAAEPSRTSLEDVPSDRLRAEMAAVERDLGRCERDTLYRETARRFGYKTLSPKARARLESIAR